MSNNLKSPLILNGRLPVGPILNSSISSNVRGATANCEYVSSAEPFCNAPDVWTGSAPLVAVVPACVTSYKLFLYLRYWPTVTGVFAFHSEYAGADTFTERIFFMFTNSKWFGVTLIVLILSLINHRVLSLAPTVSSAKIVVFPSKSLTPPKDDHDKELVLYPSYWFVSVLYLIQPSFTIPAVGLSAVVPTGIAIAVLVKTSAILPVSGATITSYPPRDDRLLLELNNLR